MRFEKMLKQKGYSYYKEDGFIIVNHHGSVDLMSLTTLPENVKFENHGTVYLRSLTTLPENVKFENHGSVYLRSLTTLPENVKFENHGSVDLESLTTLPENVKFENHGTVYLESLTTLPENVKFENHGSVDLRSLQGIIVFNGEEVELVTTDGYSMVVKSRKSSGDIDMMKCHFLCGSNAEIRKCFVVSKDNLYAHGERLKEATDDLLYKITRDLDTKKLVEQIKKAGVITIADYRALTGACRLGVEQFLNQHNIPLDQESLPISDVVELVRGAYGGDKIRELFA